MRLDKMLAHAGFGSRRDVKELVKKKLVTVDNKVIRNSSIKVNLDKQIVRVQDELVVYKEFIYLMLHKPQGYISATFDHHDKTVIDLVPAAYQHFKVFPVGRLDKDTEGLLLLTNDGKLNHALTSPKRDVFKRYFAKVTGRVEEKHMEEFKQGVTLDDGYKTKPAELRIIKSDAVSEIELSISEGKFHQVKRMFEAIGMKVIYLKRISMEKLLLDDSLKKGEIRELTEAELSYVLSFK